MNLAYLNDRISMSRVPITAITENLGISRQAFYNKISGKREFKISEVEKICAMLRLTREEKQLIFFADSVDKYGNPTISE